MMNKECNLITPENIQRELINNEIEQINLRAQAFKEQKYNELLKENKDLQQRIDKAIEYIKEYASYIDYLSIDRHKEIGHLDMQNVKELLEILGGKE